ncbi:MAG TPA: TetR/AcrR family transcriptional regulator [Xanthobacteraceae bacterium]|jgi:AcrR family transcriptional regulator|nr:TetR/AcrR family transcriptional regulator [Xanthobacteraceae bacterium]
MPDRLTARDWIDFGLTTLAREGADALKADVLARKLGVSRGSFYWHFRDLAAFHARVIEQWKEVTTDAIIADIERYQSLEARLEALLRHAFGDGAALEVRMRAWAESNAAAARALDHIDRRRRGYIERLLVEAGIAPAVAATRTQVLYWAYLGAALNRSRLAGARLERMVAELKRIGLGGRTGKPAGTAGRRGSRSSGG